MQYRYGFRNACKRPHCLSFLQIQCGLQETAEYGNYFIHDISAFYRRLFLDTALWQKRRGHILFTENRHQHAFHLWIWRYHSGVYCKILSHDLPLCQRCLRLHGCFFGRSCRKPRHVKNQTDHDCDLSPDTAYHLCSHADGFYGSLGRFRYAHADRGRL